MIATLLASVVAALHALFALAETVGWNGMAKRLGMSKEDTETTRSLALNQGFYNLGIAGLLGWALLTDQGATVIALLVFVIAMAIVGALSVRWTIMVIQGVPAIAALAVYYLG